MIRNAYILYIDDPRSESYMQACYDSCKQFPDINPIPVKGYKGAKYQDICAEFGIDIIPYYVELAKDNPEVHNRAFSCSAGHFKIWQMIADSNEPGVVLEHDAIVKGPLSNIDIDDNEILWLGPRIEYENDYKYPLGAISDYVDVDRWEGTHAYAITPNTARHLLQKMKEHGLNDSIDGQLGMRNIFEVSMVTVDPPPVVAVVGNRESCIEQGGNPGFWNAHYTPGFLRNFRQGAKLAPVREVKFNPSRFDRHINDINDLVKRYDGYAVDALVLNTKDGYESLKLCNRLLRHDESQMTIITAPRDAQLVSYNMYFSWYYMKANVVPVDSYTELLYNATSDTEIAYDVIYYKPKNDLQSIIVDLLLCWKLLKRGGILFIDDFDNTEVANIVEFVIVSVMQNVTVSYGTSGIAAVIQG